MHIQDAKFVSQLLSEKASEMQTVIPYKTTKRGEPPIHSEPTTFSSSTDPQCKRSIIHVLAHADRNDDHPAVTELTIPSCSGFHASLNVEHGKSKAYFHMSYNQSPIKSVIKLNDIMNKFTNIITVKHMPFAFLVGDLPVHVLVTLLKAENSVRYHKWKAMKKESFLLIPPDTDSLRQQFIQANYLTHLVLHPLLKKHPSPIGHGWELMDGNCCPVRHHTYPALPTHLPTLYTWRQQKKSEEDKHEENDEEQEEGEDDSEQNEEEWSDLN